MSLKMKKTSHFRKKIQKLKDKIKKLSDAKVYVGYYMDQGIHHESQMSYVDLMTIHEYGVDNNGVHIPARPVLHYTNSGGVFLPKDKEAIKKAFKGVFVRDIPISVILNKIGKHYQQKGREVFGSTILLPTVKGNPPLIDTGDLVEHFSYRTSVTYRAS